MEFYTAYKGSPLVSEENHEPSMVMTAGYIPDDLRIMESLTSKKQLHNT